MALKNILSKINSETQKEISGIQKNSQKKCEKIFSLAKQEAGKIKQKALENFKLEKQKESEIVIRAEKNKSYKKIIQAKQKILNNIFEQALKKLQESDRQEEGKFISETIEIDNTFPALIQEARQKLETKIANLLF